MLNNADLHCANLHGTNLDHGADVSRANLSGADISNDDFRKVRGFTKEQLLQAYWDRPAKPGEHLPYVPPSMRHLRDQGPSRASIKTYGACQNSSNA
jgi:hypothetical protein